MAHITVKFEVEMQLDVPDEVAARMSLQDLCDSVTTAAHRNGDAPVILGNEVLSTQFAWAIRPAGDEITPDGLDVYSLPGDGFVRLDEAEELADRAITVAAR